MSNIRTEWASIKVNGEEMRTYVAQPEGTGKRPTVIVFEEIFGINAHIRDVTERVAKEGYVAIAPDYHHRAWAPGTELPYTPEGMKKGMETIPKLSADGMTADIEATLAHAKTLANADVSRLGVIGFCIGGHAAYFAAATQPVKAAASFYGGGIATFGPGNTQPTVERTAGIKGKIICFFGGKDPMIPPEQVQKIKSALETNKVRHEVHVYPDASHAFFCDVKERGSFVPKAAEDAWARVKVLFAEELGK